MHLSPAEYVIRTIGGVRKTARAIGREPGTISKWRSKKGCDGSVPRGAMKEILKHAKDKKLDITVSDLVLGRSINGKIKR